MNAVTNELIQLATDRIKQAAAKGKHKDQPDKPPNLRLSDAGVAKCASCKHFVPSLAGSSCDKYKWPVEPDMLCDSFEPKGFEPPPETAPSMGEMLPFVTGQLPELGVPAVPKMAHVKAAASALRSRISLQPMPQGGGFNMMLHSQPGAPDPRQIGYMHLHPTGVNTGPLIGKVDIDPKFRKLHLGRKFYMDAARQLPQGQLMSGQLGGGMVTPAAQRVWESMIKRPGPADVNRFWSMRSLGKTLTGNAPPNVRAGTLYGMQLPEHILQQPDPSIAARFPKRGDDMMSHKIADWLNATAPGQFAALKGAQSPPGAVRQPNAAAGIGLAPTQPLTPSNRDVVKQMTPGMAPTTTSGQALNRGAAPMPPKMAQAAAGAPQQQPAAPGAPQQQAPAPPMGNFKPSVVAGLPNAATRPDIAAGAVFTGTDTGVAQAGAAQQPTDPAQTKAGGCMKSRDKLAFEMTAGRRADPKLVAAIVSLQTAPGVDVLTRLEDSFAKFGQSLCQEHVSSHTDRAYEQGELLSPLTLALHNGGATKLGADELNVGPPTARCNSLYRSILQHSKTGQNRQSTHYKQAHTALPFSGAALNGHSSAAPKVPITARQRPMGQTPLSGTLSMAQQAPGAVKQGARELSSISKNILKQALVQMPGKSPSSMTNLLGKPSPTGKLTAPIPQQAAPMAQGPTPAPPAVASPMQSGASAATGTPKMAKYELYPGHRVYESNGRREHGGRGPESCAALAKPSRMKTGVAPGGVKLWRDPPGGTFTAVVDSNFSFCKETPHLTQSANKRASVLGPGMPYTDTGVPFGGQPRVLQAPK